MSFDDLFNAEDRSRTEVKPDIVERIEREYRDSAGVEKSRQTEIAEIEAEMKIYCLKIDTESS